MKSGPWTRAVRIDIYSLLCMTRTTKKVCNNGRRLKTPATSRLLGCRISSSRSIQQHRQPSSDTKQQSACPLATCNPPTEGVHVAAGCHIRRVDNIQNLGHKFQGDREAQPDCIGQGAMRLLTPMQSSRVLFPAACLALTCLLSSVGAQGNSTATGEFSVRFSYHTSPTSSFHVSDCCCAALEMF